MSVSLPPLDSQLQQNIKLDTLLLSSIMFLYLNVLNLALQLISHTLFFFVLVSWHTPQERCIVACIFLLGRKRIMKQRIKIVCRFK